MSSPVGDVEGERGKPERITGPELAEDLVRFSVDTRRVVHCPFVNKCEVNSFFSYE